jgi:hypothetical protein
MDRVEYERRLMNRQGVKPVAAGWRLDRDDDAWAEDPYRCPPPVEEAEVLEVSVTGARLRAPFTRDLHVGSRTIMEVGGVSGSVIVRHIETCTDLTRSDYGVEFAEPNSPLPSLIFDMFLAEAAPLPSSHTASR